jgi:DNA replication protein DnaC
VSYNGKLMARARDALERFRTENAAETERRTQEVYARLPRVREIDGELRRQMVALVGLTLRHSGELQEELTRLERENLLLQGQRAELLTASGYPGDYTDPIYSCKKCRDTGMLGAEPCDCLLKLYNRELTQELGGLLRCGDESFDRFDLSLYSAEPSPGSPRETMTFVRDTCIAYADNFGHRSTNLLFQGPPGLGKTFLSACIARAVSEKGFSVAYESAAAALGAFETARFSRDSAEGAAAHAKTKQYQGCDLMILDDLGTEMVTTLSVAALHQIINTRLLNDRKTIISTNCTDQELTAKYGAAIMSRLVGEYDFLPFVGRDIRLIRKERA